MKNKKVRILAILLVLSIMMLNFSPVFATDSFALNPISMGNAASSNDNASNLFAAINNIIMKLFAGFFNGNNLRDKFKPTPNPDTVPVQYYQTGSGRGYMAGCNKILSTSDLKAYYDGAPITVGNGKGELTYNIFHSRSGLYPAMADEIFLNASVYNDAYFKNKFLVFISVMESSGSFRHRVDSIEYTNNGLTVNLTTIKYTYATTDIKDWHIVLELPISWKSHSINVNQMIEFGSQDSIVNNPAARVIYR